MKLKLPSKRAFILTLKFVGLAILVTITYAVIILIFGYLFGNAGVIITKVIILLALIISMMMTFDKTENKQND